MKRGRSRQAEAGMDRREHKQVGISKQEWDEGVIRGQEQAGRPLLPHYNRRVIYEYM
jgi:hypothetical protein